MKTALEKQFLPPEGWQQAFFFNEKTGHTIHYASLKSTETSKTLFILPGLSEFSEKYIETANFFNAQGFNVHVIDWAYQGRSTRFKDNREKRHSDGYDADLSDLRHFIKINTPPSSSNYFLCHSMGAHIGIRYLSEFDHDIKSASFSAPMTNIKSLSAFTPIYFLLSILIKPFSKHYVPDGENWKENERNVKDIFSSDPIRKKIHYTWSLNQPTLRLGNVTNRWLIESLKSIKSLKNNITIPCLVALAEKEDLVCNKTTKVFFEKKNNIEVILLKNSKHEILMETNDIRDKFLEKTLALFKSSS